MRPAQVFGPLIYATRHFARSGHAIGPAHRAGARLPEDDRRFLRALHAELRGAVTGLRFGSPRGFVHGDAHVQNLMVGGKGQAVFIDFEGFGFDPTLRRTQEFTMTTWLMRNASTGGRPAGEYARRIVSLRDEKAPRDWRPL
ncbi:phosphotransferase family protein [Streptomyces mobaraensis]|uniref:phosphotransferase family protein n=1 Tax=Streptomyces mobaraensis TaxID=35621 RepID=UPI00034D532F|nr:phosphotransferase [Streptomyces mobaraensis]